MKRFLFYWCIFLVCTSSSVLGMQRDKGRDDDKERERRLNGKTEKVPQAPARPQPKTPQSNDLQRDAQHKAERELRKKELEKQQMEERARRLKA